MPKKTVFTDSDTEAGPTPENAARVAALIDVAGPVAVGLTKLAEIVYGQPAGVAIVIAPTAALGDGGDKTLGSAVALPATFDLDQLQDVFDIASALIAKSGKPSADVAEEQAAATFAPHMKPGEA